MVNLARTWYDRPVKRWAWTIPILGICFALLMFRNGSPDLLTSDSATRTILANTASRDNAFSWFGTGWPLGNHRYRPIPALSFELDQAIFGSNPSGYALTNALIVVAMIGALMWFAWELTRSKLIAPATATLFGLWCLTPLSLFTPWVSALALVPLFGALIAREGRWSQPAAVGAWVLLAHELAGLTPLRQSVLDWIPGRANTLMAVFALSGFALAVRTLRSITSVSIDQPPSPLDLPATKNSVQQEHGQTKALPALFAVAMAILCAYSHEQGVAALLAMIPLLMTWPNLAVNIRNQVGVATSMTLIWIVLSRRLINPGDISQIAAPMNLPLAEASVNLLSFVIPTLKAGLPSATFSPSAIIILTALICMFGMATAWIHFGQRRPVLTVGFFGSVISYLPMAWVTPLPHHFVMPMAFRALFVVGLAMLACELTVSAVRRPTRQAPPRLVPAPGSLPHP